jgi:2-oxoisovalerate dehydrogenase E1 component
VGATLFRALEAAKVLESQYGVSTEVLDIRFINPLNYGPLAESRAQDRAGRAGLRCLRTGFVSAHNGLQFDPAGLRCAGWAAGGGRRAQLDYAACGAGRFCFSPPKKWIIDAIHERILPLAGHIPSTRQETGEILRRNRLGA